MSTIYTFSAPGRTEISGNHTDHQHGCVLAAAVNMKTTAEVELTAEPVIRVCSEGYDPVVIDLRCLEPNPNEKNTTAALALAMCDMLLKDRGAFRVHGGGFAGTVQAFVPADMLEDFRGGIEKVFGKGSCHVVSVCVSGGQQE